MATVVETLALELQLDSRDFITSLRAITAQVKSARDQQEQHAKGLEAVFTGLFRVVQPLAAAFLSVEAILHAIDWTKHTAEATTSFGNLSEVIGGTVEELSAWKQAAEAVAGSGAGERLLQGMAHLQEALQKMGPHGTGEVDLGIRRTLQYYGIDERNYYDAKTRLFDIFKILKDVTAAADRLNESTAERLQRLQSLGVSQEVITLFASGSRLEEAIRFQRERVGTITKPSVDAMKQLQTDFSAVASAATNLGIAVVEKLANPLHKALVGLQEILTKLKDFDFPSWLKGPSGGAQPTGIPAPTWGPSWLGGSRTGPAPVYVPPSSGTRPPNADRGGMPVPPNRIGNWFGDMWRSVFPSATEGASGSGLLLPSTREPFPVLPSSGVLGATEGSVPGAPSGTHVPATLEHRTPDSFGRTLLGPRSALDLPRYAAAATRGSVSSATTTSNASNVTIGSMSFNTTTSDTKLGHAPASSEMALNVGSYAVHSNTSLE